MKISFHQPPPELRVGGLDAAIQSMAAALRAAGVEFVERDAELQHFHGLWRPEHARAARAPYVVSPHGMLEPWAWRHKWWKKWPYFLFVERRFLRRAAALLATSEMEAAQLRRFFPRQRIEVLPLGLTGDARPDYAPARARLGWREDETVLLFLSRIHPKKGLDLLLRAVANLPVRLAVVGTGEADYLRELRSLAGPNVDWLGEVWGDARWKFFQGADLFCLPSHSENFGLAVLEACQVGTPPLVTNTTPWPSLLGERAFAAKPDEHSIRAALRRFLASEKTRIEEREELAGWTYAHFHWDALAPRYPDFYRSVLEQRR